MVKRFSLGLVALFSVLALGTACQAQGISQKVATCDPAYPNRCIKPDANGAIALSGSIAVTSAAKATAAAPTYVEGTTNPLSVDLTGKLRTTATGGGGGASVTATAAAPSYVEGSTDDPLSSNLTGDLRTIAKQSGTWNVGTVTTLSTVSTPVGVKGVDGSTIASGGNPVPVDGTVDAAQSGTWNVTNVSGTVSLPTGASTSALQSTGNTSLSTIATNTGAATPAGTNVIGKVSIDQTTPGTTNLVSAGQTGTWNVTNVSGTVSLPTGASTAARQDTGNTSLATVATGTGAPADSAWASGSGSQIALLKSIATAAIDTTAATVNLTDVAGSSVSTGNGTASGAIRVALPTDGTGVVGVISKTTGGCTPYTATSAASNNSTLASTGAHTLCSLSAINTSAVIYYLRLYDLASAPTCSSATGFVHSYPIPANASGAGFAIPLGPFGEAYALGLGFCLTGGGSSTDNTNAATGIYVNASYK